MRLQHSKGENSSTHLHSRGKYKVFGLTTKGLRILNKKENSKFLLRNITLFN